MSKLLVLLGSISILTPFSLDLYLPALPSIATDLHASAGSVQLTLPVFFVGLAISQLFFGSVADHVGRRPPLLCGLALLVLGSVGCALAHAVNTLTIWRLVQALGVGSASVIPRAIVRDRFDVAHTARALSLLGLIIISTLGFNFSNGFALGLAPFGASAGTASALFGTLQFLMAGVGGAAVSALYDGSARAMTGVMCAVAVMAVALYRWMR
jgi:DHA1 family bicyclomycin/chloramphenicol resistance-like MFS transporter